jgi:hypothetical protein
MNFARCKCDERATQWLMHNAALALHVGNESCCGLFALAPFDVVFASAHRSLRADTGRVIATGLAVQAGASGRSCQPNWPRPIQIARIAPLKRDRHKRSNAASRYLLTKYVPDPPRNDNLFISYNNDHANHA